MASCNGCLPAYSAEVNWLESLTLATVIVHTVTGISFRGLLQGVYADCLVLRDAIHMSEEVQTPLDGTVPILRTNIDFMQVLGGVA